MPVGYQYVLVPYLLVPYWYPIYVYPTGTLLVPYLQVSYWYPTYWYPTGLLVPYILIPLLVPYLLVPYWYPTYLYTTATLPTGILFYTTGSLLTGTLMVFLTLVPYWYRTYWYPNGTHILELYWYPTYLDIRYSRPSGMVCRAIVLDVLILNPSQRYMLRFCKATGPKLKNSWGWRPKTAQLWWLCWLRAQLDIWYSRPSGMVCKAFS